MKDASLVKLCRQLSKTELRKLRKVVRSPFFNQREDVVLLFEYLETNLDKDVEKLDRAHIFKHVFPKNVTFEMPLLRHAASFLMQVIRDWLAIEEMRADAAKEQIYVQNAFKRLGLEEFRGRELPEIIAVHKARPQRDGTYYRQYFELLMEECDVEMKQNRTNEQRLGLLSETMTISQVSNLLNLGCTMRASSNFSGKDLEFPLLNAAIEQVLTGKMDDIPAVMAWFHTYKCLENVENEVNFQALKSILNTQNHCFSKPELGDFHLAAINFCIRRANQGRRDLLREAFDLYESGFRSKALIAHGRLSKYTYKNAVNLGIHLSEFEWVHRFLEDFKPFLPEADRENLYKLSLAKSNFQQKQYDAALLLLQDVALSEEPLFSLDARRMLVRIFYEQQSFAALGSQLESYSAYLRRHKEVGYYRENHHNFIGWVRKLMRADLRDGAVRAKLGEKLAVENSVLEKDWLSSFLT